MKKNISHIISQDKKLVLKGDKTNIVNKYSLKDRDYRGERFVDNKKDLFGFCEILSLTKPDIISEIHERYLKTGIDIIVTNSSKANRIALSEYGLEENTYELNMASAKIARGKVSKYNSITRDKPRFAAGCISNLSKDNDFDYAESIYSEQIKALFAGKVDFLFFNSFENRLSLKAAFKAYDKLMKRRKKTGDVLLTIKNNYLSKLIDKDFFNSYENLNLIAVGYNLKTDDDKYLDKIEELKEIYDKLIISFENYEKELNQDAFLKKIEKLKNIEEIKIIGLERRFFPEFVKKFIDKMK